MPYTYPEDTNPRRVRLKTYNVTFRESAIVTEQVQAYSKAEAIRLVKVGEGERVGFEIDESRFPTSFAADVDERTHSRDSG